MLDRFLDFGKLSVKKLMTLLFLIGTIGIFAAACARGYMVALTHTYFRTVPQGGGWYTSVVVHNWPLGFLVGVLCFVIGTLLWRLVCEMLYIILSYFKESTLSKDCGE